VFVSASGDVDLDAAAFTSKQPVVVLTTTKGARRLDRQSGNLHIRAIDGDQPRGRDIVRALAVNHDWRRILTEGGPTLFGLFLRDGLVDQMFQTIAPQIVGRSREHRRLALVAGTAFPPVEAPWGRLLGVKRSHDDFLFLRFAL
jgi:riboflavin biosynthesis pyrimidine reductase